MHPTNNARRGHDRGEEDGEARGEDGEEGGRGKRRAGEGEAWRRRREVR